MGTARRRRAAHVSPRSRSSITAGSGGKGTVWIDALTFTPLEPIRPYTGTPVASATSDVEDHAPALASDGRAFDVVEERDIDRARRYFSLDFGTTREYGGATIDWAPGAAARDYVVETSDDGAKWDSAYAVNGGNGGRDWIYLPETESRYLRVRIPASASRDVRDSRARCDPRRVVGIAQRLLRAHCRERAVRQLSEYLTC